MKDCHVRASSAEFEGDRVFVERTRNCSLRPLDQR
jgi:hypothetical protein